MIWVFSCPFAEPYIPYCTFLPFFLIWSMHYCSPARISQRLNDSGTVRSNWCPSRLRLIFGTTRTAVSLRSLYAAVCTHCTYLSNEVAFASHSRGIRYPHDRTELALLVLGKSACATLICTPVLNQDMMAKCQIFG